MVAADAAAAGSGRLGPALRPRARGAAAPCAGSHEPGDRQAGSSSLCGPPRPIAPTSCRKLAALDARGARSLRDRARPARLTGLAAAGCGFPAGQSTVAQAASLDSSSAVQCRWAAGEITRTAYSFGDEDASESPCGRSSQPASNPRQGWSDGVARARLAGRGSCGLVPLHGAEDAAALMAPPTIGMPTRTDGPPNSISKIEFWDVSRRKTFVRLIAALAPNDDVLLTVGAQGPEDLLSDDEDCVRWVEAQAAASRNFRQALANVYVDGLQPATVARLERAAGTLRTTLGSSAAARTELEPPFPATGLVAEAPAELNQTPRRSAPRTTSADAVRPESSQGEAAPRAAYYALNLRAKLSRSCGPLPTGRT